MLYSSCARRCIYALYSAITLRSRYGRWMVQCAALIRHREPTADVLVRGLGWDAWPTSNERCSRRADGDVCGVPLCWQHRAKVTYLEGGTERLKRRADAIFATWCVRPS